MPAGDVGSLQRSRPITSTIIVKRLRFYSSRGCSCICSVGFYPPLLLLSISYIPELPQVRCQTLTQYWASALTHKDYNLTCADKCTYADEQSGPL